MTFTVIIAHCYVVLGFTVTRDFIKMEIEKERVHIKILHERKKSPDMTYSIIEKLCNMSK